MTITPTAAADALRTPTIDEHATGRDIYEGVMTLIEIRNLTDHHLSVHVAALERLGVARQHGRSTRELLIIMGLAPAAAQRLLRIATALDAVAPAAAHAADGVVSGEHMDAIVRGVSHVERRSPTPLDNNTRESVITDLMAQRSSGATPAEIAERARTLGNQIAAHTDGGLPPSEDRTVNSLTLTKEDGRTQVRADLDTVTGEKLWTAIDRISEPRPQPDGSKDPRSPERRRADALETILDLATSSGRFAGPKVPAPQTRIALTIPADTPSLSSLQFLGSVTEATAKKLACDATISVAIVDGEQVPLSVGREKRLFTSVQRRAFACRDKGCVKCGAPASWTHAHHIVHWADGGDTDVDNGCLLCPACHDDVHHGGWEVIMGTDRHPWLRPPVSVDSRRELIESYHRRRMHVADLPDLTIAA
ncbi:DUF222 domain-containing protein [Gordonia sp. NPDC003425]